MLVDKWGKHPKLIIWKKVCAYGSVIRWEKTIELIRFIVEIQGELLFVLEYLLLAEGCCFSFRHHGIKNC